MAKAKTKAEVPAEITEPVPAEITEESVGIIDEDAEELAAPKVEKPLSDKRLDEIANERERSLRKAWAKEPNVTILIPFAPGEEKLTPVPTQYVNINGIEFNLEKNKYVVVPQSVANLIMESQGQTTAALLTNRIDGNPDKEKALF